MKRLWASATLVVLVGGIFLAAGPLAADSDPLSKDMVRLALTTHLMTRLASVLGREVMSVKRSTILGLTVLVLGIVAPVAFAAYEACP